MIINKKYKVLLLGYSNIAKKRYINTFVKKKIPFCVASRSFNKKIKGAYKQFDNYNAAIKFSDANIVFISLPNSLHYYWSKQALLNGYHLIVDKPITVKRGQLKKLINIAKKKNLLISEATYFNYHKQFEFIRKKCGNFDNIEQILVNFTIPMPKKSSLLLSKKFNGGVIMDMGPYVSSIKRIFFKDRYIKKYLILKKNLFGLIISLDIILKFETKIFIGTFKFGGDYKNNIFIKCKNKSIEADRLFSPPDDKILRIKVDTLEKIKVFNIKKHNCFQDYFFEVLKNLKYKNFDYYNRRMIEDENFRLKLIK